MNRLQAVEDAVLYHDEVFVSARDVADAVQARTDVYDGLGDPRREALDDLRLIERDGRVASKKIGARARGFWHVDRVLDAPPEHPAYHPDQADLRDATIPEEFQSVPASADVEPLEVFDDDQQRFVLDADHVLEDVEFPAGRDRAECLKAVDAAGDYIREHNGASMRDLVRDVLPEHPVGYDVVELQEGERYRGAWWRRIVKPGLENLPQIAKPPRGGSEWRYVE